MDQTNYGACKQTLTVGVCLRVGGLTSLQVMIGFDNPASTRGRDAMHKKVLLATALFSSTLAVASFNESSAQGRNIEPNAQVLKDEKYYFLTRCLTASMILKFRAEERGDKEKIAYYTDANETFYDVLQLRFNPKGSEKIGEIFSKDMLAYGKLINGLTDDNLEKFCAGEKEITPSTPATENLLRFDQTEKRHRLSKKYYC